MKMNQKTINFILFIIFIILNWLMDLHVFNRMPTTNGFIRITNPLLAGHIEWYLSIGICLYFAYQLLVKEK